MSKLQKSIDPLVIQMAMIHSLQSQLWLESVMVYKPKGLLKKSVTESVGSLRRLNKVFKQGEGLFDVSIEISDSLERMMKLSDSKKESLTKKLDELISEYEKEDDAA